MKRTSFWKTELSHDVSKCLLMFNCVTMIAVSGQWNIHLFILICRTHLLSKRWICVEDDAASLFPVSDWRLRKSHTCEAVSALCENLKFRFSQQCRGVHWVRSKQHGNPHGEQHGACHGEQNPHHVDVSNLRLLRSSSEGLCLYSRLILPLDHL